MRLDKIITELKKICSSNEIDRTEINDLIQRLEQAFKELNYAPNPTDKTKLAAIKKVIKAKSNEVRPILQSYTIIDDQVAFTDGYQLYMLNDKKLPFTISFTNGTPEEIKQKYLQDNPDIKEYPGAYPNLKNCIPDQSKMIDTFTLNVNDINTLYKTTPKDNSGIKEYNYNKNNISVTFDLVKIDILTKILKLKDDFTVEFYGKDRPLIVRNNGELGLILPMIRY